MPKSTKNRLPISSIESELITILEFARVAFMELPSAKNDILDRMDLSDEAFKEAFIAVADTIGFDINDPKDDEE